MNDDREQAPTGVYLNQVERGLAYEECAKVHRVCYCRKYNMRICPAIAKEVIGESEYKTRRENDGGK